MNALSVAAIPKERDRLKAQVLALTVTVEAAKLEEVAAHLALMNKAHFINQFIHGLIE